MFRTSFKNTASRPHQPPLASHRPEDLQDTARLLTLFAQAQTQGLIGKSASDRLTFLALAEHAKVVGSQNPCGLFAALVQRQHWHFVTDSDEEVAQTRLKTYLYGPAAPVAPPPAAAPPALSPDAAIVRYVRTQLARAGWGMVWPSEPWRLDVDAGALGAPRRGGTGRRLPGSTPTP